VAVELDKMLLGADPVAGIDLMVQTGMGEVVLPEIGGMQMAIDEHHQHKDVYQHSLTVLRQAIDLRIPRSRPIWCCGGPRCCTTSASRRPAATSRTAG
jgi:poly(A) polymerase